MFRFFYIAKSIYLEKLKQLIIWDEGSTHYFMSN